MLKFMLIALASASLGIAPSLAQTQKLTPEEARADLTALYQGLEQAHYDLYVATPRAAFEQRYQELMAGYDGPVTLSVLHRDFQRFTALARHGHARIEGLNPGFDAYVEVGGGLFPLSFDVRDGQVVVTAAPEASGVAPGDHILSLNGAPNGLWLPRLLSHISAETPALAYRLLAGSEAYYIWLELGSQSRFTVEIEREGARRRMTLDAVTLDVLRAVSADTQGPDLSGRDAFMVTEQVAYLRPGGFYNIDAQSQEEVFAPAALRAFNDFIDGAYESFIAADADALILDLRNNPGGDSSYSDPVVAWFADQPFRFASEFRIRVSPQTTASNQARLDARGGEDPGVSGQYADLFAEREPGDVVNFDLPYAEPRSGTRFEGEVYALINAQSFSNTATTAALIQDYGFATVVGQPTTDMATTYGSLEYFTLPNSGFNVGYPKAHIIRPNGEERSHPVTPDVLLPNPAPGERGDVVLQSLLELIEAQ